MRIHDLVIVLDYDLAPTVRPLTPLTVPYWPRKASPYRMRFAIYVRKGDEAFDAIDTVPEQLRGRTLAVRAFDADGMMAGWELVEGDALEDAIARLLPEPRAAYLHVHFAAPGCYAARIERA